MGESVSEKIENPTNTDVDLRKEIYTQYRLIRKNFSAFIRKQLRKNFIEIVYITAEKPPFDFVLSLQKQYPDKAIKFLVPLIQKSKEYENTSISFDYFMQNKIFKAEVFLVPSKQDNIKIYGIYSDAFEELTDYHNIFEFKNLIHFVKTARKTALKLKPDIIYTDNVPFLAGLEFGSKWLSGYPIKFVQTFHNLYMYDDLEPFWAAINMANKDEMKRICKDKYIKKNIASLFNIKNIKNFTKMRECLNEFYNNYEHYKENANLSENTKKNRILNSLNKRIIKMFPICVPKGEDVYNLMYHSLRRAGKRCVNNLPNKMPKVFSNINDFYYLKKKPDDLYTGKIMHDFDSSNFREVRFLNKRYLNKELTEKRIETKFISPNLFVSEEINICGYLNISSRRIPLLFVPINRYTKEEDIKTVSIALLNLIEQGINFNLIYNFPNNYKSEYLKSLIEFFESQPLLKGKWVAIEGEIDLPQFLSSSDMVLFSSANNLYIENNLYNSLKHGCIPVTASEGSCNDIVVDIFDDMNCGTGFKTKKDLTTENNDILENERLSYNEVVERAVNFYINNNSSWNLLVENALNYDNSWDFKSIEEYNDIYDDII